MLQVLGRNANKLLADIETGIQNARIMQMRQKRFHQNRAIVHQRNGKQSPGFQYAENSVETFLDYIIASLEKERMWISNYRDQANVALTLLNILVSQQDARNNLDIAASTQLLAIAARKDSRSMNSIAALTMLFLPATFFAVSEFLMTQA